MEEQIDEIGKEISLAYRFYQGYGYFLSSTVAQWLGSKRLAVQNDTRYACSRFKSTVHIQCHHHLGQTDEDRVAAL